jgi:hypothetical protein
MDGDVRTRMAKHAKQARFSPKSGSFFQIYTVKKHSGCFG